MARKETFEKVATALNNRLKLPSKTLKRTIYGRVFPAGPISRTFRHKPIHYCSDCGCEVEWIGQKECPQCHAKWAAKPEKFERRQKDYHMILEAHGDIQVCRIYDVERRTRFGKQVAWLVIEVERIMYAPSGERKVFARGIQGMSFEYDAWSLWNDKLSIRREGKGMSTSAQLRYNLTVYNYHIKSLTQQWQYKEIPFLLSDFKNDTSVLRVIAYPYGETLYKTGQVEFFRYLVNNFRLLPKGCTHALNICHRNHYRISDPSLWLDHLELLKHFHLDTHNSHYVCPADLRAEHQVLLERKRREDERRRAAMATARAEREARERMERDKKFADMVEHWAEHMGAILTLSISGNDLSVRPLQSIEEFKQEGLAMHHCVYQLGYYDYMKRPNCLILSAKDSDGKRLATIEYNTERHDIVQCRAACNAVPERDKEIRQLIIDHRKDIEDLLHKEVKAKAKKKQTKKTAAAAA